MKEVIFIRKQTLFDTRFAVLLILLILGILIACSVRNIAIDSLEVINDSNKIIISKKSINNPYKIINLTKVSNAKPKKVFNSKPVKIVTDSSTSLPVYNKSKSINNDNKTYFRLIYEKNDFNLTDSLGFIPLARRDRVIIAERAIHDFLFFSNNAICAANDALKDIQTNIKCLNKAFNLCAKETKRVQLSKFHSLMRLFYPYPVDSNIIFLSIAVLDLTLKSNFRLKKNKLFMKLFKTQKQKHGYINLIKLKQSATKFYNESEIRNVIFSLNASRIVRKFEEKIISKSNLTTSYSLNAEKYLKVQLDQTKELEIRSFLNLSATDSLVYEHIESFLATAPVNKTEKFNLRNPGAVFSTKTHYLLIASYLDNVESIIKHDKTPNEMLFVQFLKYFNFHYLVPPTVFRQDFKKSSKYIYVTSQLRLPIIGTNNSASIFPIPKTIIIPVVDAILGNYDRHINNLVQIEDVEFAIDNHKAFSLTPVKKPELSTRALSSLITNYNDVELFRPAFNIIFHTSKEKFYSIFHDVENPPSIQILDISWKRLIFLRKVLILRLSNIVF